MSICKQGKHFYYSFRLHGRRYHGACKECSTMRQARAYEKELKAEIEKAAMQEDAVRFRKCAMRKKSDNQEILLSAAIELALAEPTGKNPSATQQKLKYSFWKDFCAFCHSQGITTMSEVTHIIAKNYFAYIREKGKFDKAIEYKRNGNSIAYTMNNRMLAPSTINKIIQTCSWVFAILSHESGISQNPFANIPALSNDYESRSVLDDAEIQLILNSDDSFCAPMCRMALFTGLREGDICSLRWSNIDFVHGIIKLTMNKTNKNVEIPIIDRSFLEQLYANRTSEEYVFPKQHEIYNTTKSGVPYRITKFFKSLGIEKNRTSKNRTRQISSKDFHSLRHTFAVKCAENDIPLHVVQQVLGHGNPRITEIYTAHHNRKFAQQVMTRFRLFDNSNQMQIAERVIFILEHFSKLHHLEQQKIVNILLNGLSGVHITELVSVAN